MSQPLDPARCPLCGQPNQCSLARGDAQPCWCFSVEIDPEALRQVPLEARDRACLCPRCARLRADEEPA
ncbi:cysteine-rich CWC family protein [Metapseudomonas otitidis]|uniref:cysteine-rich CWC family protein n=1 Tax=Metapseudomonas otitidis TaxID=319939 RepID=UPI002448FA3A|nr:cysteine-rich CWC family protein [Pseudomonas otitidis]MDG9783000.1 cysteine-rich CWC family protein [Pseudomonas otitidis]